MRPLLKAKKGLLCCMESEGEEGRRERGVKERARETGREREREGGGGT